MIERLPKAVDKGIYEEIVYFPVVSSDPSSAKDSKFRVLLQ
jgi:hypothetical protein